MDEVGNIVGVNQSGTQFNLSYDKLYRLTDVKAANNALIEGFTYDATGNRLSKQLGATVLPYSYAATDHKLTDAGTGARSFDANGNSTGIPGTGALSCDERNRLVLTRSIPCTGRACNEVSSQYNARGERVLSAVNAINTLTLFSESGQLLSEGDTASTSSSVIYLDSIPVARVTGGVINPIEADHLGSPRVLQKPDGSGTEWTWDLLANTSSGSNAFGEQAPAGKQVFNMRFPGQYSDGNGLSYNYFRDYESGTGRYVESDPIGLAGGISSFGYVFGAPLNFFDDEGTEAKSADKCTGVDDFPGGWNFRKCCAKHDDCYDCPGKANSTDRPTCDTCFCNCLKDLCNSDPMPAGRPRPLTMEQRGQSTPDVCVSDRCRRVKCAGTAKSYCTGVRRAGSFFFQKESCE